MKRKTLKKFSFNFYIPLMQTKRISSQPFAFFGLWNMKDFNENGDCTWFKYVYIFWGIDIFLFFVNYLKILAVNNQRERLCVVGKEEERLYELKEWKEENLQSRKWNHW